MLEHDRARLVVHRSLEREAILQRDRAAGGGASG